MIIRYIKKYYARSIVIFLSFLFSMVIICTNGIMKESANKQNIEFLKSRANGSLVSVTDMNREAVDYLKSQKDVSDVKILNFEDFSDLTSKYRINVVSKSDENKSDLKSGRMPENKDEVVAQEWVLKSIGKKQGETLEYKSYFDKEMKHKKITGVLKDVRDDKEMGKTELVTYYKPGSLNEKNAVDFDIENDRNLKKNYSNVISTLKTKYKIPEKNIMKNKMLYNAYMEDGNTLKETLALMIVSVIFSSIIVFSTYFISLRDRIRDIGILRAMGIGRFDAVRIISEELIVLAAPAMVIGTAISMAASSVMNKNGMNGYYESTEGAVVEKLGIPVNIISTAVVMILISIVIMSVIMYAVSMRNNPIDSINVENQLRRKKGMRGSKRKSQSRFFEKMNIGRMLSFRYFKKDSIVMMLIIICMSAAVSEIMVQGYHIAVSSQIMKQEKIVKDGDIFIDKANAGNDDARLTEKQVEKMTKIDGVKDASWSGYKYGTFDIPKDRMNTKEYFDEKAKSPYIKEVLGGLYKENKDGYTVKTVLNGYNDGGLKMLEKYSVDGKIDLQKMKDDDSCIIYYPKYYVNLKDGRDSRNMLLKYKTGDTITVEVPKSITKKAGDDMLFFKYWKGEYKPETVKKKLKIAGVVDYLPSNANFGPIDSVGIVMSYNGLKKLDYDDSLGYTNGAVFVEKGKDQKVYSEILKEVGEDSGLTVSNMYSEHMEDESAVGSYMNLETAKYAAFILICVMCIFNILSYKVMNKKKDFSMFRSLGMTDGDMKNMIISEGLIYAGTATVISLIITVAREYFIIKDYEINFHVTGIAMDINVAMYLAVFIIYIAICVLGVYIPSRKLLKENITEGIRSIN